MSLALGIAIIVVSLVLIAAVLMQEGDENGLGALGAGNSDTFFGKNKSKALNAKLAVITKWGAVVFVVLCILMLIFG